ncbi:MAG: hypothetical protein A2117_00985 [Candidatus Wildermuthbacteria bacterium GWA2_46_15]|uniref:Uncharacterized protein n=1 Tax=Candidatus Wildermuthbacteria bacterium GWA2_46_15 TaxID=1802443 RepID=A0A1G2QR29_9BACT|nr:MAG: hypothetical protein A2117_00985 [Candidatus Wildermuthbacteria bacterium GWA2_46_15]
MAVANATAILLDVYHCELLKETWQSSPVEEIASQSHSPRSPIVTVAFSNYVQIIPWDKMNIVKKFELDKKSIVGYNNINNK